MNLRERERERMSLGEFERIICCVSLIGFKGECEWILG